MQANTNCDLSLRRAAALSTLCPPYGWQGLHRASVHDRHSLWAAACSPLGGRRPLGLLQPVVAQQAPPFPEGPPAASPGFLIPPILPCWPASSKRTARLLSVVHDTTCLACFWIDWACDRGCVDALLAALNMEPVSCLAWPPDPTIPILHTAVHCPMPALRHHLDCTA